MGGLLGVGTILLGIGVSTHLLHRTSAAGAAFQPEPFIVLFSGLVMAALLWGDRPRVLWWTVPLRFLGYISYGLYMLHTLVFQAYDKLAARPGLAQPKEMSLPAGLFRFAIVFMVSVFICFLSRRYFEDYFLRLKSRLAPNTAAEKARSHKVTV
jgi:peptidoglycan/LPS O-acetylase OafA/YrhL